jgi:Cytochrome C assembly protein
MYCGGTMDKLEERILQWRQSMMQAPGIEGETLDELENHLRECSLKLVRSGTTEAEAFRKAVAELGEPALMVAEFRKLHRATWLPVKVMLGVGIAASIGLGLVMLTRLDASHGSSLLLAGHVFTLTLGYVTLLLTGTLGICFVCQRCFSEFSQRRLQSIRRFSFGFGGVATGLIAVGTILGMLWAKAEWGRYLSLELKELAALGALAWSIGFMTVHRLPGSSPRRILLLSIVGNMVVSVAWLGPGLVTRLHSYGTPSFRLFAIVTAVNAAFFLAGLVPASRATVNAQGDR